MKKTLKIIAEEFDYLNEERKKLENKPVQTEKDKEDLKAIYELYQYMNEKMGNWHKKVDVKEGVHAIENISKSMKPKFTGQDKKKKDNTLEQADFIKTSNVDNRGKWIYAPFAETYDNLVKEQKISVEEYHKQQRNKSLPNIEKESALENNTTILEPLEKNEEASIKKEQQIQSEVIYPEEEINNEKQNLVSESSILSSNNLIPASNVIKRKIIWNDLMEKINKTPITPALNETIKSKKDNSHDNYSRLEYANENNLETSSIISKSSVPLMEIFQGIEYPEQNNTETITDEQEKQPEIISSELEIKEAPEVSIFESEIISSSETNNNIESISPEKEDNYLDEEDAYDTEETFEMEDVPIRKKLKDGIEVVKVRKSKKNIKKKLWIKIVTVAISLAAIAGVVSYNSKKNKKELINQPSTEISYELSDNIQQDIPDDVKQVIYDESGKPLQYIYNETPDTALSNPELEEVFINSDDINNNFDEQLSLNEEIDKQDDIKDIIYDEEGQPLLYIYDDMPEEKNESQIEIQETKEQEEIELINIVETPANEQLVEDYSEFPITTSEEAVYADSTELENDTLDVVEEPVNEQILEENSEFPITISEEFVYEEPEHINYELQDIETIEPINEFVQDTSKKIDFGSTLKLESTSAIYKDSLTAYLDDNNEHGLNPYWSNDTDKILLGGLYEDVDGNFKYIYMNSEDANKRKEEIIKNGGKLLSALIAEPQKYYEVTDGTTPLTITQINKCAAGWIKAEDITNNNIKTGGIHR